MCLLSFIDVGSGLTAYVVFLFFQIRGFVCVQILLQEAKKCPVLQRHGALREVEDEIRRAKTVNNLRVQSPIIDMMSERIHDEEQLIEDVQPT